MRESEELNKKLMATHTFQHQSNYPSALVSFVPVRMDKTISVQTLWNTSKYGNWHFAGSPAKSSGCTIGPLEADGLRSQREGGGLLDFIRMRAMLEGFPSWAQNSAERQNLNLQAAQWPAFKFSPSPPVSPLRHTHTLQTHAHTAYTESIWTVTDVHTGIEYQTLSISIWKKKNICVHTQTWT